MAYTVIFTCFVIAFSIVQLNEAYTLHSPPETEYKPNVRGVVGGVNVDGSSYEEQLPNGVASPDNNDSVNMMVSGGKNPNGLRAFEEEGDSNSPPRSGLSRLVNKIGAGAGGGAELGGNARGGIGGNIDGNIGSLPANVGARVGAGVGGKLGGFAGAGLGKDIERYMAPGTENFADVAANNTFNLGGGGALEGDIGGKLEGGLGRFKGSIEPTLDGGVSAGKLIGGILRPTDRGLGIEAGLNDHIGIQGKGGLGVKTKTPIGNVNFGVRTAGGAQLGAKIAGRAGVGMSDD